MGKSSDAVQEPGAVQLGPPGGFGASAPGAGSGAAWRERSGLPRAPSSAALHSSPAAAAAHEVLGSQHQLPGGTQAASGGAGQRARSVEPTIGLGSARAADAGGARARSEDRGGGGGAGGGQLVKKLGGLKLKIRVGGKAKGAAPLHASLKPRSCIYLVGAGQPGAEVSQTLARIRRGVGAAR